MLFRKEVKALAKRVAADLRTGKPSAKARRAREFMGENAPAIVGAIDLMRQEADRKHPDDALIYAYREMIAYGLEVLRFRSEAGDDGADMLVEGIREMVQNLARDRNIGPDILILLIKAFIEAKLPAGEELSDLLAELAADETEDESDDMPSDIAGLLEAIADEAGGDEFQAYAALMDVGEAMPAEFREIMAQALATAEKPVLRDCATLFLLDSDHDVRRIACQAIAGAASASAVSPNSLRRMIAIRNWLPKSERAQLDGAIRNSRKAGTECAPWPRNEPTELLATAEDGAGAQSVFAVARDGRKHVFAALLVKQGAGIADAWCQREQTKADINRLLDSIRSETGAIPVDMAFARQLTAHHLAQGLAYGEVPAAGLLDYAEAVGLEDCQPAELDADDLIALMEPDIEPARLTQEAVEDTLERSFAWIDEFGFMDSWFEADSDVNAVLSGRSRAHAAVKAIVKSVLEPRRRKWAERFLWTALWSKQQTDLLSPWVPLFIVGRELHRGRKMAEIPVMQEIAEMTVAATEDQWD